MTDQKSYGLPSAILSSLETLAQSIAGIAPTAAPAMTVALVFGMAGNAAWLTYIIATVIVALTALAMGLILAILAFVGFESAAHEQRNTHPQ
jgi:hypothetical protein